MKWSLFVLILMGQCCFFMCQLYEYHFINKSKTWEKAKEYCKEKYTDLATVYNMTDMERLLNSTETRVEAWTGLYNNSEKENRPWHWSLPGLEYNDSEAKWENDEPDNDKYPENCVAVNDANLWFDIGCEEEHPFICYDEKKQPNDTYCVINKPMTWSRAQKNWDPEVGDKNCALLKSSGQWRSVDCEETKPFFCYDDKVILIKENKTWEEAEDYCSVHHHGLVSITNSHQQEWVQKRAKNADTPYVWLGLRFSGVLDLWFWVSDQLVCYDNWDPAQQIVRDCDKAAAMKKEGNRLDL
ncbi:hypothetical protein D5F01_LYC22971 [Larimichthys crocea]|uniref:C-type lectin domain-containing protein n=1 Tax=Larimichthys crocea TaxID=215358 RepID=A0A6G0HJK6_LARCR|nr:hypothetical protein D5F01_LYC22971 [Larimichthys crocea]